jgi:UDP-N-acetyl-D-mannosaminuronic acid dehydrogenase
VIRSVGVVGLGYVGLTLTAALASRGATVYGAETSPEVRAMLSSGRPHLYEPGIGEVLGRYVGRSVFVAGRLPARTVDVAVICVSTPIDPDTLAPDLTNLRAAARQVAAWCGPDTLVVVRSTVPVGTSRAVVAPVLAKAWGRVRLVMAPERTIQGQALRELVELPQVVGGIDEESLRAGVEFFAELANRVVPVSSLEAAELVKLANNCHTDLIYGYGNEVALIAEQHRLDPLEVIRAANLDYPRPDLAKPGYVGGGCLSKDPYLLLHSAATHRPWLVGRARELNEYLPVHVAERVVEALREAMGDDLSGAQVAVLGWAYKGWPPTDDMRGTPIVSMLPVFRVAGLRVAGHDPLVGPEVIRRYGGEPVEVKDAFRDSDAVLVINDHPDYRGLPVGSLLSGGRVRLVYDSWRVLDEAAVTAAGVRYAGIGYLPAVPALVDAAGGA